MRKLQVILCSAVLTTLALTSVSAAWAEDEQNAAQQAPEQAPQDAETTAQGSQAEKAPAETATAEQPSDPTIQALADSADPYSVKSFFADFTHFAIGDTVPDLYRTKKYEVTQWAVRHLPAPVAESHWSYMGGNYVMITNADGKILKAESGDIYYKH
ncbi:RcnB family protein [Erwiniaceae bacterium CAU 1747]